MKNIYLLVLSVLVLCLMPSCEMIYEDGYARAGYGYQSQGGYGRPQQQPPPWGKVDTYRQRYETPHEGTLDVRVVATNHKLTQADALITRDRIGRWAADIHTRYGYWPNRDDAVKQFSKSGFQIIEYVVPVDTVGQRKSVGSPEHVGTREIQQSNVPQWILERHRQQQYDLERLPGDFKDHLHRPVPSSYQQRGPQDQLLIEEFDPDIRA